MNVLILSFEHLYKKTFNEYCESTFKLNLRKQKVLISIKELEKAKNNNMLYN